MPMPGWPRNAGATRGARTDVAQIREQMALAVNRVMAEGSLYDPDLAALAIKQARGDLIEAVFLIRAYRTTLPRFGASNPVDTAAMAWSTGASRPPSRTCRAGRCWGRPSTTPTACSTFALMAEGEDAAARAAARGRRSGPDAACHRAS
jgi:alpha-D-ribose 1-methylphosphonate 5-triphosphate synthase subunit PhnI